MTLPQLTALSIFIITSGAIPSYGSKGSHLTFHCSTVCKVYMDGAFVAMIQRDAVKVIPVTLGQHSILITRVGKKPWSYAGSITEDMIFDPDQDEPETFGKNHNGSGQTTPLPEANQERSSAARSYPAWLEGDWIDETDQQKAVTLKVNSFNCKGWDFSYDRITFDKDGMSAGFSQDLGISEDEEKFGCAAYELDESKKPADWNIEFSYPIIITSRAEGEISFKLDLSRCLYGEDGDGCKVPSQLHDVSGKIVQLNNSRIKLIWQGQLADAGEQVMKNQSKRH